MADFAKQIGAPESAQEYANRVKWMDGFMQRIGATEMIHAMKGYRITPESLGVAAVQQQ
jgi:hypothetical protein